jgi:hypothetical protein
VLGHPDGGDHRVERNDVEDADLDDHAQAAPAACAFGPALQLVDLERRLPDENKPPAR